MREAFLAVDVSLEAIEDLVLVQEDLGPLIESRGAQARWIEASSMHLGLKSLGRVDEALLFDICEVVSALASSLVPFKVSVKGLHAHPGPKCPRVLFSRIDQGAELIGRLRQVLDAHLGGIGIEGDHRPFAPMVHVGRVLTAQAVVDLSDVLEEAGGLEFGDSYIKNMMLLQTELTSKGPRTSVHRRFVLGR